MATGRRKEVGIATPFSESDPACPDEIEITDEMIEAGIYSYLRRSERFETREEIVSDIYRAMALAKTKMAILDNVS